MTDGQTFRWNGETAGSAEFHGLYTELMSIFIERELSREEMEKVNGKDRELLMRVTYERNRDDAPRITQCYYAYDETYASVQVNGTEFFWWAGKRSDRCRRELKRLSESLGETLEKPGFQCYT